MMKNSSMRRILFLLVFVVSPVWALDGGVESLRQTSKAFASVARAVSPSVVFIQVEKKASGSTINRFSSPFGEESPFSDDFFKRLGRFQPGEAIEVDIETGEFIFSNVLTAEIVNGEIIECCPA